MSAALLLAGALFAQAPAQAPLMVMGGGADRVDVAYEELMAGQNRLAIEIITSSRLDDRRDPAAMINLGTAHARLGDKQLAKSCYEAAIASRDRYDLQLADGTWRDSRRAAREAIAALGQGRILALR